MNNLIKSLTTREWALWLSSLLIVSLSNVLSGDIDILTLLSACIGVTSLIFAAIGNIWSQILMIVFSLLYAVISWQFHYWGEMITYLGMTMPMAIWSTITWMKNPSENGREVAIQKLSTKHIAGLIISGAITTFVFYLLLCKLDTPNIIFSTISVTTSFLAAALTMLRSSYYALGYAANDIVLWALASLENSAYIAMMANFLIFFVNDMYGLVSWKKRERSNAKF